MLWFLCNIFSEINTFFLDYSRDGTSDMEPVPLLQDITLYSSQFSTVRQEKKKNPKSSYNSTLHITQQYFHVAMLFLT
jgi:hypothetical protein